MRQRYLVLDYETRSEAELKQTGGYEYANHPSTKIMCIAWRFGTKDELRHQLALGVPAAVWSPAFPENEELAEELDTLLMDESVILIAHNAIFEQVITRFVLSKLFINSNLKEIPHDRWICTASMAAALALPRNLEGACLALKLPIQKDMDGRRLMLKLSKPRKASKNNQNKWHNSARDLRRIMEYCQKDVDAETMLFLTLPPLNDTERKVWLLDQKINFRGFQVDKKLIDSSLKLIEEETRNLNHETKRISGGQLGTTTQRNRTLEWLHRSGVFLPDLRAKTVSDALKEGLVEGPTKRMLEIRQAVSKTSTAKYRAFDARSRTDQRVRDILVYHTASTGRWGGAGVQPQNFPRGSIADTTLAADILCSGDLEFVRLIFGDPMEVLSSCLRAVIVAPQGREFYCADFAAIEARVLFWVGKHAAGLRAFFSNEPMYEQMAQVIYGLPTVCDVTKIQRQVGKQTILGCGYGMGWRKFIQTCKNFGIEIDEETAQVAVSTYREVHWPVVKLWSNLEKAAIAATERKGTKFKINHTAWWVEKLPGTGLEILYCELPSKRRLAYFGPEIKHEPTKWGEIRPVLYH